jgi:hypothetical protein
LAPGTLPNSVQAFSRFLRLQVSACPILITCWFL